MTSVPNLLGFQFVLISSENKPVHYLTILSQTFTSAEFATIQGTWQGQGGGQIHEGTGDITSELFVEPIPAIARHENRLIEPLTFVRITFQWQPSGNVLTGTLTPNGTNIWRLDGTVAASGAGGGPGNVSGDGQKILTPVPDVTGWLVNDAQRQLTVLNKIKAADLVPQWTFNSNQNFTNKSWIIDQNPKPDSLVALGSTAELDVSNTIAQ